MGEDGEYVDCRLMATHAICNSWLGLMDLGHVQWELRRHLVINSDLQRVTVERSKESGTMKTLGKETCNHDRYTQYAIVVRGLKTPGKRHHREKRVGKNARKFRQMRALTRHQNTYNLDYSQDP